jgi:hypothetical protein
MGHKWRKILTGRRVRAIAIAGGFAPAFAVLAHSPAPALRGEILRSIAWKKNASPRRNNIGIRGVETPRKKKGVFHSDEDCGWALHDLGEAIDLQIDNGRGNVLVEKDAELFPLSLHSLGPYRKRI